MNWGAATSERPAAFFMPLLSNGVSVEAVQEMDICELPANTRCMSNYALDAFETRRRLITNEYTAVDLEHEQR
jgi:hypothetical protein